MYDVKDSKERDENRHGIPNKSRQTVVINKTQLVSGQNKIFSSVQENFSL